MTTLAQKFDFLSGNKLVDVNTSKNNYTDIYSPTTNTSFSNQVSDSRSFIYSPNVTYIQNSAGASVTTKKEDSISQSPSLNNAPSQTAKPSFDVGQSANSSKVPTTSLILIAVGVGAVLLLKK